MKLVSLRSYIPDRLSTPAKLFLMVNVLNGIANGVFGVIIQLYFVTLGFQGSDLGSLAMVNSLAMMFLCIPAGVLADRYGKGKVFLSGYLLLLVSFTMLLVYDSFEMIAIAWVFLGMSNATGSVIEPLYSSLFDSDDMDRAFGLRGFLNIISSALGSLFGFIPPMLVSNYGYTMRYSYWLLLVGAVVVFFTQIPFYVKILRGVDDTPSGNGFSWNLKSKGVVAKFSVLYTLMNIAMGVFLSLFPYYVNTKFSIESDGLGALYSLSKFISAASNVVAPRIAKTFGTLKTISGSLLAAVPFWFMFPFAPNFVWISVIYSFRLGIANLCSPLARSLMFRVLYDDEKATANSIITTIMTLSNATGPKLGGYLMENVSIDLPPMIGGGLYILYGSLFYLFLRNEPLKEQKLQIHTN